MKLSLCSEYALLSLIHLARRCSVETSTLEAIADAQHIPGERLVDLLAVLAQTEYINQARDGYRLARPADQISVAEIIRLFDGALAPVEPVSEMGYQEAPMEREEKLAGLFGQVQAQIVERIEKTSLAELI